MTEIMPVPRNLSFTVLPAGRLLRACFAHSLHRTIAVFVDGLFVVTVWALLSFRLHRHAHCLSFVSALVVEFSYF